MILRIVFPSLCLIAFAACAQQPADDPEAVFNKAVADFRNGRVAESAAGVDKVAKLVPDYTGRWWDESVVTRKDLRRKQSPLCRQLHIE